MSDVAPEVEPPRGHGRVVYLGPVAPHWEVYGDWRSEPAELETEVSYLVR